MNHVREAVRDDRPVLAPSRPFLGCSAEAAKRDLSFAPPKSLQERLAETVSWYQQERWL